MKNISRLFHELFYIFIFLKSGHSKVLNFCQATLDRFDEHFTEFEGEGETLNKKYD